MHVGNATLSNVAWIVVASLMNAWLSVARDADLAEVVAHFCSERSSRHVPLAASGVEEQPYRDGSVELTTDVVATESDMAGRVRKGQSPSPVCFR